MCNSNQGKELHDASSQLRSLRLEHAHHKEKALITAVDE